MRPWQFNIMFTVAIAGAVFLLLAPAFGIDATANPTALTGYGAILTYVLTQRASWTHDKKDDEDDKKGGVK